jgi:hypothetical protein
MPAENPDPGQVERRHARPPPEARIGLRVVPNPCRPRRRQPRRSSISCDDCRTAGADRTTARSITPELALGSSCRKRKRVAAVERDRPSEIARTLQEVAELLQLTNANTFKVRAYENAARALAGIGEDFDAMLAEGTLDEIPGVGSSIAEKVATLATTGRLPYLDELRSQVPSGLLALLRIPGLGPKKAQALNSGLGIHTVEELEVACREGRLADLRGFGEKTAQNILLGIEQLRRIQGSSCGATRTRSSSRSSKSCAVIPKSSVSSLRAACGAARKPCTTSTSCSQPMLPKTS